MKRRTFLTTCAAVAALPVRALAGMVRHKQPRDEWSTFEVSCYQWETTLKDGILLGKPVLIPVRCIATPTLDHRFRETRWMVRIYGIYKTRDPDTLHLPPIAQYDIAAVTEDELKRQVKWRWLCEQQARREREIASERNARTTCEWETKRPVMFRVWRWDYQRDHAVPDGLVDCGEEAVRCIATPTLDYQSHGTRWKVRIYRYTDAGKLRLPLVSSYDIEAVTEDQLKWDVAIRIREMRERWIASVDGLVHQPG